MQASDSFKALAIHFESNLSDGADSMARRHDLIIIDVLVSSHQIEHYFRSICHQG